MVIAWASNDGGSGATIASVADNASNTYSEAGAARAVDTNGNTMLDMWYAKSITAGATTVTVTPNPSGTHGTAVIWEFAGANTTAPLDQTATLNSQAATTTPAGASLTVPASEVIVSAANVQGNVTGIASGSTFTGDSTANGDGWAHLITASSGTYAAQWTNSGSGTYASSSASFKAASSGGGSSGPCDLNQDGVVNSLDVTLAVAMSLGTATCTANLEGPDKCTVITVQRVIDASSGQPCVVYNAHAANLSWTASTSSGVSGYNVYRSTTSGGPYTILNSTPVSGNTYQDTTVQAGQTYYYVVTAVSGSTQSANSNQATGAIPTP